MAATRQILQSVLPRRLTPLSGKGQFWTSLDVLEDRGFLCMSIRMSLYVRCIVRFKSESEGDTTSPNVQEAKETHRGCCPEPSSSILVRQSARLNQFRIPDGLAFCKSLVESCLTDALPMDTTVVYAVCLVDVDLVFYFHTCTLLCMLIPCSCTGKENNTPLKYTHILVKQHSSEIHTYTSKTTLL